MEIGKLSWFFLLTPSLSREGLTHSRTGTLTVRDVSRWNVVRNARRACLILRLQEMMFVGTLVLRMVVGRRECTHECIEI